MQRLMIAVMALLVPIPLLGAQAPLPLRHRHPAVHRVHGNGQVGTASWYGPKCQGHETASGAIYDENKLTAAHRTLPLGTRVKVTNLRNGRSVIVKINDRGPWVYTRLIDLSKAAAERLGFRRRGTTRVRISVLEASKTAKPIEAESSVNAGS